MAAELFGGPEPLDPSHDVQRFDCGAPPLNEYLRRQALPDQQAGKSRTYVAFVGIGVIAYFSLAAASVEPDAAIARVGKGQGGQSIPCVLLARFAVDVDYQGHGLGQAMLMEALRACLRAADVIGVRAVLVHAKDESTRDFYERYGFMASPTHPLHVMMPMKDVRANVTDVLG